MMKKNNKSKGGFGGSFLCFYISLLFSMALKYILNQYIIVHNKEDSEIFYAALIGCHIIPIILALIFYFLFAKIFESNIPKPEDKKESKSGCRLFGCIIYKESEDNPLDIKCEGIRKGCRKCYFNCFCYCCCCCKCFSCNNCCCDSKTDDELSDVENRDKMICIIYKSSGVISWFCDLLTNRNVMIYCFIMLFLQLINCGFRGSLSSYLSNCEEQKRDIINLLGLAGIFLFYFFIVLPGCVCAKFIGGQKVDEGSIIGFGLPLYLFPASLVSFIFSLLAYYEMIDDTIYYLIPFSIGSIEFYLILLKRIASAILPTEFLSADFVISIYIIFWNIFTLILELSNASSSGLILTQFIFTSIAIPILLCLICLFFCKGKEVIQSNQIENKEENKEEVFLSDHKNEIKEPTE